MSTSVVGCSTPYFIRSTRLVPPPRNFAPCGGAGVDGGVGGGGALVVEGVHARAPLRGGADGGDDVGVGAAAADVAAHALADLVVGELRVLRCCRCAKLTMRELALLALRRRGRRRSRSGRGCSSRTGSRRARGRRPARGGGSSPLARPSMVVISAPSAATARVRQELTRRPSSRTVQAPHWPWSQPFLRAGEVQVLAQGVEQGGAGVER